MQRLFYLVALGLGLTCHAAHASALESAEAQVRKAGYQVINANGFDSSPLGVLLGQKNGGGDGYAKNAFFFYKGRYLGTDTVSSSATISLVWQDDKTAALMYVLYRPDDPMCCPTGGGAIVRYHYNGQKLLNLDAIPTDAESAPLSRR
jgi:hypothetical protein